MSVITPELVRRATAGDRPTVRALVDALTPVIQARVARVLLRAGRGVRGRDVRQEVEDLTQHVFERLFAGGGAVLLQWDPARGLSLLNYVGLLAEREAVTVLRSRRRSPFTEEATACADLEQGGGEGDGGALEARVASREALTALVRAMKERLSEQGLQMFTWLLVEERTVEDVCALADMSPDAVYAWRSRLTRLARALGEEILSDGGTPSRKPVEKAREGR
ncbi:RNA polymerase sigma factor [Chondromyces crocatus]|uniref:ECF subfamily RNA polymerase sigma-24 subunit n=1 Tax=Chondromyces crocatus TaxID=52 RepID=A0A0K1EP16_CHOCO|nr:hypothetical protein [Chondromyces crocatus]AKT42368.1 ECF subfamily RNA polymerase sigma-24 subunit [Chondromyces crocatus]